MYPYCCCASYSSIRHCTAKDSSVFISMDKFTNAAWVAISYHFTLMDIEVDWVSHSEIAAQKTARIAANAIQVADKE